MSSPPGARDGTDLPTTLARLHRGLRLAALGVAVATGVGLATGTTALTRVRPEWPEIYPYTVAGTLVLLAAMWLIDLGGRMRARAGRALAVLVAVFAGSVDLAVGAGLLPSSDTASTTGASWVTAVPTLSAVSLALSIALVDVGRTRVARVRFWVAAVAITVPLLGLLSYLYQSVTLFESLGLTGTSLPTSVLGMLVAGASLTARPWEPPLAGLAGRYDAGLVTRGLPLLVALPLVPPAVAWLVGREGIDPAASAAVAQLVTVVIMIAVVVVAGGGQSRARQALAVERAQVWAAFAHAPSATALTTPDGRILLANAALGRLVGVDTADLVGRPALELIADPDRVRAIEAAATVMAGERDHVTDDVRLQRHDGGRVWVEFAVVRVAASGARAPYLVVQMADLTQRKDAEQALAELASTDRLTGLANREGLQRQLAVIADQLPPGQVLGLVFADVDGLKPLNDALGHTAGDDLLREVAGRLTAVSRASDVVARVGGDEFVVVTTLRATDPGLDAVLQRLRDRLSGPVDVAGVVVPLSVSLGGAVVDGHDVDAALRMADLAMYEDKRQRRGGAA